MTEYFGRQPFAQSTDTDYIPSIPWGDEPVYEGDTPDPEVKVERYLREKQDARKRGVATDWNPEIGEILLLAFYNNFTVETLKQTLAEARERYSKDAVKQMAISLAVEEARGRRFELHRWQFEKVESRCNSRYWVYVKVLGVKPPKAKPPVVDVKDGPKPDPKIELKPLLTVSEYQAMLERKDVLDKEIERLQQAAPME